MYSIIFTIPHCHMQEFMMFLEENDYKFKRYNEKLIRDNLDWLIFDRIEVFIPIWGIGRDSFKKIKAAFATRMVWNICFLCNEGYIGKSVNCQYCSVYYTLIHK